MLFISSTAFDTDILDNPDKRLLSRIKNIEISGGNRYYPENELHNRIMGLKSCGVQNLLIHNYFPTPAKDFVLNFASDDPDILSSCFDLAQYAISLCRKYRIPFYSFHPGYLMDGQENEQGHFDFNPNTIKNYQKAGQLFIRSFTKLYAYARKKSIRLVIENLFPAPDSRFTSLNNTYQELSDMLASLPSDVGLLLDLGHLNISAYHLGFDKYKYIENLLVDFRDRIFEIHLSANNGPKDDHLPLTKDDWQLEVLPEFATCSGVDGRGVFFSLEARKLSSDTLDACIELIQNQIQRK